MTEHFETRRRPKHLGAGDRRPGVCRHCERDRWLNPYGYCSIYCKDRNAPFVCEPPRFERLTKPEPKPQRHRRQEIALCIIKPPKPAGPPRECPECGTLFEPRWKSSKHCGADCLRKANSRRGKERWQREQREAHDRAHEALRRRP
jgi:hypothetical protein